MADGRVQIDVDLNKKKADQGVEQLKSNLQGLAKETKQMSSESVNMAKNVGAALVAVGTTVAAFSIKSAGDLQALNAQFEQVFEGVGDSAQDSIDKIADETGMLPNRLKGSFTQMAAFAKTTGMDTADALSLTERATLAAADSAAFYDSSIESVSENLQSFLKGNYENDAALGISATETTRNAKANELYGKSFIDLSESQKQLTLLAMVEDGNKLSGAMGQASRETDGLENVMGNLKRVVTDLAAAFGTPLLAPFVGAAKGLTSVLGNLAEVLTENPALVYAMVGAFLTLVSALAGVYIAANAATWLASLKAAVIGTSTSIGLLTNPIFLIIAAIGAAVTAFIYFYNANETFRNGVNQTIDHIKTFVAVIGSIGKTIVAFFTDFSKLQELNGVFKELLPEEQANALWSTLMKILHTVNDFGTGIMAVAKIATGSISSFDELDGYLQGAFGADGTNLIMTFGQMFGNIFEAIKGYVGNMIDLFADLFEGIKIAFSTGNFEPLLEAVKNLIPMMIGFLMGGLPGLLFAGARLLSSVAEGMGVTVPELLAKVTGIITSLIASFAQMLPQLIQTGVDILLSIIDGLVQALPLLIGAVLLVVNGLTQTFTELLPVLLNIGISILTALIQGIVLMLPLLLESAISIIMALVNGLITMLPTIIDAGIQLLNGLIAGIVSILPMLIATAVMLVFMLVDTVLANLPTIINAGIQILNSLIDGIVSILPQLVQSAVSLVMSIVTAIINSLPMIINAGVKLLVSLIQGILSMLPSLLAAGISLIIALLGAILKNLPQLLSAGKDLIFALIDGVLSLIGAAGDAIAEIGATILSEAKSIDLLQVGKDIVSGLWNGISSMGSWISSKVSGFFDGITGVVKGVFNTHSPSRVFRDEIGKMLPRGVVVGVESEESATIQAVQRSFGSITDRVKASIGSIAMPNVVERAQASVVASAPLSDRATTTDRSNELGYTEMVSLLKQLVAKDGNVYFNGSLIGTIGPEIDSYLGNETTNSGRWGG